MSNLKSLAQLFKESENSKIAELDFNCRVRDIFETNGYYEGLKIIFLTFDNAEILSLNPIEKGYKND